MTVPDHGIRPAPTLQTRTGGLYKVLKMRDGGHADVLSISQVPANKADAVPCEGLRAILTNRFHLQPSLTGGQKKGLLAY